MNQNSTIFVWVAVTKLLIKQFDAEEDVEKSTDYMAMHAIPTQEVGKKVYDFKKPLVKSTYTNE